MKLEIAAKDWNAIRLFIREEEATLRDNYGLPVRKGKTWEDEYQRDFPRDFEIFTAARGAILRARPAR